jgi:hypothetical protein
LYFSEFLETCTIRWGLICEDGVGVGKGNAFLWVSEFGRLTTRPPALPVYPAGDPRQPQRTRTDCTSQAAAQGAPKPGQTMQDTAH